MKEISIVSTKDGSPEPGLFFFPDGQTGVPLLVGLHTWSYDRFNQVKPMLPLCQSRNWALLLPEFRGPNKAANPRARQACASPLARQDILDAVDHVLSRYAIDARRIFLLGGSGGGHMALMMAAHAPARWRAVSSWVPITDLAAWYRAKPPSSSYAQGIAACCGGLPGQSPEIDREYRERSPLYFNLEALATANLAVHHGRFDGSVSYAHTVALVQALEKLAPKRFFFEIFDGGHELRYDVAFRWFDALASQTSGEAQSLTG